MRATRFAAVLLTVMAALLGRALPAAALDSFTPNPVAVTLVPGASTDVSKTLHLDASPAKADVIIAIDTTASMCGTALAQAQAEANQLVDDVKAQVPGARFAVVDFKDYPVPPFSTTPDDYPYLLKTPGFTADPVTVHAAIDTLVCGGGGDTPESYDRVFYEAYSDPALTASRDSTAPQFLVVLGNAPPHGDNASFPACGNQGPTDPGRDNVVGTSDDLPTETVISGLAAHGIELLMIAYEDPQIPSVLPCYEQLVAPTGGLAVPAGGGPTLSQRIIADSRSAATRITRVELRVSAGCGLGVTFSPPPPYGPFTAPVDIQFTETITAPALPGSYTCTVTAVVDGVDRAVQTINATVTPGRAAKVTLTPATATNPVGVQHCVTATVTDSFGNPVPGATVYFLVTGPNGPRAAVRTTDASGQAQFCYTGTRAGVDTIRAVVGGTAPPVTAKATKTYTSACNDQNNGGNGGDDRKDRKQKGDDHHDGCRGGGHHGGGGDD